MATNNNNMTARTYTLEYRDALETVFGVTRAFGRAFQPLQVIDGIRSNATAFTVKTNNTPVVIQDYNKGENVGFGTGTGTSTRFGPRQEIIYKDTDVPYAGELVIHEGLDVTTLNNDLDAAVLDRLYLQAEAQTKRLNTNHGAYISTVAGNTETIDGYGDAEVLALFNKVSTYQTNKEVAVATTAYVKPDLYNAIVDHPLVTGGKGSKVDIDGNTIYDFKGFDIEKTPDQYFTEDDVAYFVPNQALIPFVGIELARTFPSEDFAGVALQALAKNGQFVLDDNKVAITKVTKAAVSG